MKSFKLYYVLFFAVFFLGCETDKIDILEKDNIQQKDLSFPEFINSQTDLEEYLRNASSYESKFLKFTKSSENATLSFDEEFFASFCSNLSFEDFQEGRIPVNNGGLLRGPLTANSNNGKFQPGEIVSGLKISSEPDNLLALFGFNFKGSDSKVILTNRVEDVLVIEFPDTDVSSLALEVYSFPVLEEFTQQVTVTVIYKSGEEFSETIGASVSGEFFSVNGNELISKIRISSTNQDGFVGIDNISFGICEDLDGDGCLNEDDIFDNLEVEATVIIGDCDSLVENRLSDSCGAYISDLIDNLENGDYKNKGQFAKAVAEVLNDWEANGLITTEEKDDLQACAAKFEL